MSATRPKIDLFTAVEGADIRAALRDLEKSDQYKTTTSYSAHLDYPDHKMPFVSKHLKYLNDHPQVDPQNYLSNLRLMLRIRR